MVLSWQACIFIFTVDQIKSQKKLPRRIFGDLYQQQQIIEVMCSSWRQSRPSMTESTNTHRNENIPNSNNTTHMIHFRPTDSKVLFISSFVSYRQSSPNRTQSNVATHWEVSQIRKCIQYPKIVVSTKIGAQKCTYWTVLTTVWFHCEYLCIERWFR